MVHGIHHDLQVHPLLRFVSVHFVRKIAAIRRESLKVNRLRKRQQQLNIVCWLSCMWAHRAL